MINHVIVSHARKIPSSINLTSHASLLCKHKSAIPYLLNHKGTGCLRLYSTGDSAEATDTSEATVKEAYNMPLDKKAEEWLQQNRRKYEQFNNVENAEQYKKVEYTRPNQPFPHNQYFRPVPPLNDSLRLEIYNKYKNNSEFYSLEKLAQIYKIEECKVAGIIKLMTIREDWRLKKLGLLKQYNVGMSNLLGAVDQPNKLNNNIKADQNLVTMKGPNFVFHEKDSLSPDEAATMLNKKPPSKAQGGALSSSHIRVRHRYPEYNSKHIEDKIQIDHLTRAESLNQKKNLESLIIRKDEQITSSEFTYYISDINKNLELKERQHVVRDKDGTLRKMTTEERVQRYNELFYNNKFIYINQLRRKSGLVDFIQRNP